MTELRHHCLHFLSRHVLALESSSTLLDKGGWLGKSALVEALDAYTAGMRLRHIAVVRMLERVIMVG